MNIEMAKLKNMTKEEREKLYASFLRENVLPALKKNEDKLNEMYNQALIINAEAEKVSLKEFSNNLLSRLKLNEEKSINIASSNKLSSLEKEFAEKLLPRTKLHAEKGIAIINLNTLSVPKKYSTNVSNEKKIVNNRFYAGKIKELSDKKIIALKRA